MSVHPAARVETRHVGAGTRIWAGAHILDGARIGENCNVGENVFIEGDVVLGDGVVIKNGVCLWDGVRLGNWVFIGPEASFTNDPYPRAHPALRTGRAGWRGTILGDGVTIGANATLVCGVAIGPWALIAAGAVVARDVGPFEMWAGVPARRIGWACLCGRRLPRELKCTCGLSYGRTAGRLAVVADHRFDALGVPLPGELVIAPDRG